MFWLLLILLLVLLLPFTMKSVEQNLEIFLFLMGIWAVLISQVVDIPLIIKSVKDPIHISLAVLFAGILFKWMQVPIEKGILRTSKAVPHRLFLGSIVITLGLLSSIITAIIAAIILVSIVGVLRLDRKSEVRFVVLACFSIGLGAALTPIGEPLSTIATSKLNEDFFFLMKLIGPAVIPAVFIFGILAAMLIHPKKKMNTLPPKRKIESYTEIIIRSIKVYLFVMALTLLGAGFEPLITAYLLDTSPLMLYWINMISAVLDNATLASAEISPSMTPQTIKAILLGLLISGGMLIPGNIPNIIAAGKLNITSIEWARFGVPIGFITMAMYFIVLVIYG
ncbi:putative cation transporter [Filibacter limicola]|uniref:Cation transporter n=2 Tax=Sporosarcina limicola TaxID=34101 RepID=A0A927MHH6_9BACL|nr:putative cation transporter [Sporosarcina limicola]